MVAIPAFFGDDAPRRCILVDVEANGLWLCGKALNDQLGKCEDTAPPDDAIATAFFPFEQITYVFDPAQFAYLARGPGRQRVTPEKPAEPLDPQAPPSRAVRHSADPAKRKNPKPTR